MMFSFSATITVVVGHIPIAASAPPPRAVLPSARNMDAQPIHFVRVASTSIVIRILWVARSAVCDLGVVGRRHP